MSELVDCDTRPHPATGVLVKGTMARVQPRLDAGPKSLVPRDMRTVALADCDPAQVGELQLSYVCVERKTEDSHHSGRQQHKQYSA